MKNSMFTFRHALLFFGALAFINFHVQSQPYYMASPEGFGAGTTGGGTPTSSNTVTVTSSSELASALTGSASVILVSGTITTSRINAVVTNKTILGLPGARLINLDQTASGSGILHLRPGSDNVIIRNLIFEGPGAYDVDGWDLLTNKGCTNFWVDHCEFLDGVDCLFDNTNDSDNITVSWCKFYNTKAPKPDGPGGSDDHRFANLVGGSDSDTPADGLYSITWAYNWWGQQVKARMVRARNAELHILNCYWNSQDASSNIGLTGGTSGATCYVEGGVFECTGSILDYNSGCSAVFDNCIGGASNVGSVTAPSYSYTEIDVNSVKSAVTDTSCGAGATLQVSSSGVVSSSCDDSSATYDIVVAKDGSGDYTTVQAAIDAAPSNSSERTEIFIKNGTYYEVITVHSSKTNLTFIGESVDGTKLTYDNAATKINPETGSTYGTSGSSSVFINGAGFYALNISFENSADPSLGQAVAVRSTADKAVFKNCKFLGNQDTYYPHSGRSYHEDCYFEGTTDFIFGSAIAYFENCDIYSKGGTSVTAASTPDYVEFGFVFNNCTVTGAGSGITDLGRPWRPYASVTYLNSSLSDVIKPEGWNNWGDPANESTARFAEYNNTGAGADLSGRVSWMTVLTSSQAQSYTMLNVLKANNANPQVTDNWNPLDVINSTSGGGSLGGNGLTWQYWTDVSGTAVSDLTSLSSYPDSPSGTQTLSSFETTSSWGDNYGSRVIAHLNPPTSGTYFFWISGDDDCELWLSTDNTETNAQLIASVPGWTNVQQWDKYSQQASAGISLTAGQKYAIIALQKEGTGGDHVEVSWQIPGGSQAIIDGQYLTLYTGGTTAPATLTKHGSGSSSQTVDINTPIVDFYYSWENATTVSVTGLPSGINVAIDNTAQTATFSGSPTEAGTFDYTITTVGGSPNTSLVRTFTVNGIVSEIAINENQAGFCSVEGTIDNNHAGYQGDGFANTSNALGAGINYSVSVPSSGSYVLRWRYANGATAARPGNVIVDGSTLVSANFDVTGAWATWSENSSSMVTVTLSAGTHSIRLEATTSSGLANIDKMEVEGISPQAASCGTSSRQGSAEAERNNETITGFNLYPNPVLAGGQLVIEWQDRIDLVELYSISGRLVSSIPTGSKSRVEITIPEIKGVYIIKAYSGNSVHTKKLLIGESR